MKKLFILLLSGMLITTSVPVYGFAAEKATTVAEPVIVKDTKDTNDKSAEPSDEALKSAILAVKEKLSIPEEYTSFNYNFNDSNAYTNAFWSLTWSTADSNKGIQVNCDVNNHITYLYKYDYNKQNLGIAKYLKSELQPKAEAFVTKMVPESAGYIKLIDAGYTYSYSGDYYYTFQRVKNGVDFNDNNITVNVNSITGEVTTATVNWIYDTDIPSSKVKLSKEEATALIKKNEKMKLVYRKNYGIIYDKNIASSKDSSQAYLVYEPSQDYISIDAKTGEVYNTRTEWIGSTNNRNYSGVQMDSMKAGSTAMNTELTKDELAKIEELKNIVSKSDAIKAVTENESLYHDKNLTQYTANLEKFGYGDQASSYVWYVNLSDPRKITEADSYRGYAWACVDAQTGKIISYYTSLKSNYDNSKQQWNAVKIKYNKDECKTFLEKFIKSQMKDRFANTVLSTEINDYVAYYDKKELPVYGGYSYQYNRVNEGIEFPDNNISGCVDGVTGKVYSFSTNWDKDITFQSAKGVITEDQAMDYYLGNEGYGLKYEINQVNKTDTANENGTYTTKYEIRLVYRPDVYPIYISPFTGEQMNADGTIYKKTKPYAYKDIENTEANRNILLLSDMNIGFEGENFLPNQNITLGELKSLLSNVGYSTIEGDDTKLITREELAGVLINWLGLDKMSKLSIYTTGYKDEKSIDSKYLGAVALAKGLGLMTGDSDNNFNPKKNLTRYDAVNTILNFITVQRDGVLY